MAEKYKNIPAHLGFNFTSTTYNDAPDGLDPSKVRLPSPCVVCITGASRGLGEAHAIAFAKAGASDIVLAARSGDDLDAVAESIKAVSNKIRVSAVRCDVTSEADVAHLREVIQSTHGGRLDVLDNNAGFLDAGWQPITSVPPDEFRRVFDVNDYGVFLVTRTLLPLLQDTSDGLQTVLGISSLSSHVAGPSIAMGMSKLALNRFIEYLAAAYGGDGLMFYSLHPGGVKTAMSQQEKVPRDLAALCGDTPELSAAMAVWLAKEKRPWLNGRYVAANWDVVELEAKRKEILEGDKLKFRMVV